MNLAFLIKRTTAALATETDPKRRTLLATNLATYQAAAEAYKKEKHTIEKHETEEGEEEEESEEESESEEEGEEESAESEEGEEESSAKGNETDRKEKKAAKKSEDEEPEDDGDDAASAILHLAEKATGRRGRSAVGALAAILAEGKRTAESVAKIQKERTAERKSMIIAQALGARRITKHEAKTLQGKKMSFVKPYLEMRPNAIVNTDEEELHSPAGEDGKPTGAGLTAEVMREIEKAVASAPEGIDRDKLRQSMVEANRQRMNGANSVGRF